MSKNTLLALAFVGVAATAMGSNVTVNSNDTIADITNARRVILTEQNNLLHLTVKGNQTDTAYRFSYTKELVGGTTSLVTESNNSWNFDMGFTARKKNKTYRNAMTSGGIAFGFVSALDCPEGMEVDMASSYEIYADLVGYNRYSRNRRHILSVSLGLDWRNYRLKGKQRFVKSGNDVVITDYPEGADIDFSRIKVFSLAVPFKYTWRFAPNFDINASAILNFNTYASIKTRYKLDGHKEKELTKHIHQRPVTVDFRLGLMWNSVGIYAKYSPFDVLSDGYGPSFKSFSAGFAFFF